MERKCLLCNDLFFVKVHNHKFCSKSCAKVFENYLDYCRRYKNISLNKYLKRYLKRKILENFSKKFKKEYLIRNHKRVYNKRNFNNLKERNFRRMNTFLRRQAGIGLKFNTIKKEWNTLCNYKNKLYNLSGKKNYIVEEFI